MAYNLDHAEAGILTVVQTMAQLSENETKVLTVCRTFSPGTKLPGSFGQRNFFFLFTTSLAGVQLVAGGPFINVIFSTTFSLSGVTKKTLTLCL